MGVLRLYTRVVAFAGTAFAASLAFAVDPYSGAFASEFTAGTESVDYYRYGSDGSMYIPSIDPKDGHVNSCDVTRRSLDGTWSKGYASSRKLGDVLYDTHRETVEVWVMG